MAYSSRFISLLSALCAQPSALFVMISRIVNSPLNVRPMLAVGDLAWDVLTKPDQIILPGGDTTGRVQLAPGGSSANVAVWAARVGMPTGFLGKVGRDRFGEFAVQDLQAEGVESHVIWTDSSPTGVILVLIDSSGQRSMITSQGADFLLEPSELPIAAIQSSSHVHITAWSVFTDPPRQAALQAARIATEAGASVSFDPGSYQMIREIGREEFRRTTREMSVDFLFPNLEEGRAMTGAKTPTEVLEALQDLYPKTMIVLKLDKNGALIAEGNNSFQVAATNDTAIDATGAGDAFCGAFLGHYLQSKNALAAAELAAQVAGWVVSRFGARAVKDSELERRLLQYGFKL
jgi:ribokinase